MYDRALPADQDSDELELRIPQLCELQVAVGASLGPVDEMRVLSPQGKSMRMHQSYGAFLSFRESVELEEGRSNVVKVDERASEAVLFNEGVEVRRYPLRLDPGQRTTLR